MKFGTSGVRGLATDFLGPRGAIHTYAFAQHLISTGIARVGDRIYIGRDLRRSSPAISAVCAATLSECGFRVIDCGELPTPALAHYAWADNSAALMVTGSHIPADRNGIKFYRPGAEITKADEAAISAIVERAAGSFPQPVRETETVDAHREALTAYARRYEAIAGAGSLSGLRVGVYQHSSVARDFLSDLLSGCGASVVPLGRESHFVAVDTEAVDPATLERLARWARQHGLHAIISTDGDSDRPLIADEKGEQLRGDLLGLVTASFIGADIVVVPVTCNSGISVNLGFEVVRTKVGSPYVIEAMEDALRKNAIVVGFEANGGFLLGSPVEGPAGGLSALPTRDAVLPILGALLTARTRTVPVSALREIWPLPVCASDRLADFPVERSQHLIAHLRNESAFARFLSPLGELVAVDRTDGLRASLASGEIVHLRPSGNAPELRCYSEAPTAARANALVNDTLGLVRAFASQ